MIVRELFALMGIQTDMASVQRAESAIEGVKKAASSLGALFFTGAVAKALDHFTRQAADVAETTALLDTVFVENSAAVQDWASKTAGYVGRSEFKLREFAAQIGAIAAPMLGTGEATAKLSTDMAQLAVDLASVFNTADKEAIVALRSGLLGESEPMRRFGVNLLDSQLEVFASSIGKSFKGMAEADKMHLRYQYILKQTALYQGNANRELESFTNSSKFFSDRLGDVAIRIGQALLPGMTRMVHWAIAAVDGFMRLARGTKIFEAALLALQIGMAGAAIWMVLPFLPAIATFLAIAAAIGIVIVAAEDLYQFFTGGLSVTGDVLKGMGVDADRVRESFLKIGYVAGQVWDATTEAVGRLAARVMDLADGNLPSLGDVVEWLGKKFNAFLDWVEPKLDALLDIDWSAKLQQIGEFFDLWKTRITDFIQSPAGRALTSLLGMWAGQKLGSAGGEVIGSAMGYAAGSRWVPGSRTAGAWLGGKLGSLTGGLVGSTIGMDAGWQQGVPSYLGFLGPQPAVNVPGGMNMRKAVQFTSNSNVTVHGSASPADLDAVREVVRQENERAARALEADLVPLVSSSE